MSMEEHLQAQSAARDRAIRMFGIPDMDVLVPAINPVFTGGPRWPALRQAWRSVTHDRATMLVSDGLSDPFDAEPWPNAGFGVELLVETLDPMSEPITATWLFALVYALAQQAADSGAFRALRDELGLFSMELEAWEPFINVASADGQVGVLFGLPTPDSTLTWHLPGGLVHVVTAKLRMPAELAFIRSHGSHARQQLHERFHADGTYHRSSLQRRAGM